MLLVIHCTFNVGSVLKHYESQLSKEKATYAGLTEAQRKNVEDMLLVGDLLEVTTDETTQIWQVIVIIVHACVF